MGSFGPFCLFGRGVHMQISASQSREGACDEDRHQTST